jgi:hypothetical protein
MPTVSLRTDVKQSLTRRKHKRLPRLPVRFRTQTGRFASRNDKKSGYANLSLLIQLIIIIIKYKVICQLVRKMLLKRFDNNSLEQVRKRDL